MENPHMHGSSRAVAGLLTCACVALGCAAASEDEDGSANAAIAEEHRYFGQPTPGLTPELFAPGIVNTTAIEFNGVFSPDGREFIFGRHVAGIDTMFYSALQGEQWTAPARFAAFPGTVSGDMAFSPDGQELYFLGEHPNEYAETPTWDIWVSRRVDGEWAPASVVPAPVSTAALEVYPVVVADGSLYFSSDRAGEGRLDLYRAQRLADGSFDEPVPLGAPINGEFRTGDTFVAPDESYMITSSARSPSLGRGDLFVSFRHHDGSWGEPIHLGDVINTADHEFCPMVTPDGRYLFFSRMYGGSWDTATGGDVFWVDARIIERVRP
jgi:hypothetical protein